MKAENHVRLLPPQLQLVCLWFTLVAIIAVFPARGATYLTGGLCHELYTNIPSPLIADLTNSAKFPGAPDVVDVVTNFETPSLSGDCYGERVSGYLLPPTAGDYVFYLASDDQGLLYLSPDASPTNKVPIATETYWAFPRMWTGLSGGRLTSENVSAPIHLEAGKAYYIEGLHKEFGGGDNFGVAWQLPGGAVPANGDPPIPGQYLARLGTTQDVTFDVAFFTSSSATTNGQVFWRRYSLAGPQQGQTLLPGRPIVPDAGGRYFYEAHPHVVIRIDSQTGTSTEMQLGPGVPELSWPTSVAFDSTRNRELLVSFGGEGYLYGYAPELESWSVVSSMKNLDVFSLVYHAPQDALYGLDVFSPYLYRCSAQGAYQHQWYFSQLPHYGITYFQCALVSVGDYIVMLIGPDPTLPGNNPVQESWIYTFDTRTAELRQTWHQSHSPPNTAPSVALASPTQGTVLLVNAPTQLVVDARDNDGSVASVEFYVNNQGLGLGTRVPDTTLFAVDWTPSATGDYKLQALATDDDGRVTLSSPIHVTVSSSPPSPKITWPTPAPVLYGTALSSMQLNATADVPGRFIYNPGPGTILCAGDHLLSTVFTPSNAVYPGVTATVTQHVDRTELACGADNKSKIQGQPNPPLTASYWGFVAGDTPASLDTLATLTTTATTESPTGVYPIIVGGATGSNYNIVFYNGTLHVRPKPNSPGSLDLTFDPSANDQVLGLAQGELDIFALALQPDGKAVIGGLFVGADGLARPNLARLNADGSVDSTFRPPAFFGGSLVMYLAVQTDGKILATQGINIYRLNADGSLDAQFSPEPGDQAGVLLVQPDGKILIAGASYYAADGYHPNYLDRLNSDGRHDPGFQRQILTNLVRCLALQADGKILAGGGMFAPGWVARFNADGTPDSTFAKVSTGYGEVFAIVALPGDQALIAGGFQDVNGTPRCGLARLNAHGTVDQGFVPSYTSIDPRSWVNAIGVQPDGGIVLGGTEPIVYGGGSYSWPGYPFLVRLNPDGTEDTAFASAVEGLLTSYHRQIRQLTVMADGRIVAGGDLPDHGLVRVANTGTPDTGFHPNLQGAPGKANTVTPQPDGKVLVDGQFSSVAGAPRAGLARVNTDGSLDQGFVPVLPSGEQAVAHALQTDGKVLVATGQDQYLGGRLLRLQPNGSIDPGYLPTLTQSNGLSHIWCLRLQPDGKLLVAGDFDAANSVVRHNLARLNADGSLDVSFDPGLGLVGIGDYAQVSSLVLQPDGKLLVGGWFGQINGVARHGLARLNPDGSVDQAFYVNYLEDDLENQHQVTSLALQPNGRVLVGMDIYVWPSPAVGLIRISANGATDKSFHLGNGMTAGTDVAYVTSLLVQPDGKILVGGAFDTYDDYPLPNIVRLLPDGQVDADFEVEWELEEQRIEPWEIGEVCGLALQPDNKILMAGWFKQIQGFTRWGIARLLNQEVPVVAPAVIPAPEDQQSPAIAGDGAGFFVVWLDRRNHSGASWTDCDVFGARVSADGRVLDPDGIRVGRDAMWASPPAVAFDGTNYLVTWQRCESGKMGPICGGRVTRDGRLIDAVNGFAIGAATGLLQSNSRLAFNGSRFLVTWTDWRNQTNGTPGNLISDIYGARVMPDGTVLDPENIPIIRAPLWQYSADVSAIGTEFLVVWEDMDGIRGARVSDAGAVSPPFMVSPGIRGSASMPVVASLGDNYLAAWNESFNIGDNIVWSWITGTRLAPTGVSLDGPGFAVRTNLNGYNDSLSITRSPTQWWLTWLDTLASGTNWGIWAASVSSGGAVSAAIPVNLIPVPHGAPAIGCNGSALLAAWSDKRNGMTAAYPYLQFGDIFATLIKLDGTVVDTNGFLVSSVSLQKPVVQWSSPAAITYGTPLSNRQLNATANVPGTFAYTPKAGTYLHAGTNQTLMVVFTPNDSRHYSTATNQVTITVQPAALTIQADDKSRSQGAPNPPLTATYVGLVAGDLPASLDTPVTLTTTATTNSPPGTYPIVASGASDADYTITHLNGTLTVLAHGGSGSLDLTFDPTARGRRTGLEGDFGFVYALALQADGKVIVSGDFIGADGIPHRDLVRLQPDGSVDPSFRVITTTHSLVEAMDIQANGQILIAGNFGGINGAVRPWLARLNPDGTLDLNFAPVFGGATHEVVRGVCVQPDQKILVGGNFTTVNGQTRYHVARLNSNGTLDETFLPLAPVPENSMDCNCLAIQPDGKVLLGHATCDTNWALCRLESNGSRDSSFALGVTQSPWCSGVRQVALQPGGKIIALGQFGPWRYLVRLNSDGSADNTFASTPIHWQIHKILAQPDGKILVGGEHRSESWPEPAALLRLTIDGMLDTTFQVPQGVIEYPNDVYALALRADGRVLLGKRYEPYNGNSPRAIVQLQPGGSVDKSFSYRLNAPRAIVSAIAPLPDGRALIGGQFTRLNDVRRVGLARIRADGTIDETFVPPAEFQLIEAVLLQPDGRALIAGHFDNTNAPFKHNLIHVNTDGSLDTRFRLPAAFSGLVHALALQSDGKILLGGEVWVGEALPRYFLRLNPDGAIDTSFDQGTGFRGRDSSINSIVVQPDNKILVAAEDMGTYNDVRIGPLVRLNPNGHLDESFAPDPRIGFVWRVALQPGGGILVLADTLMRLRNDGSLDPTWQPAEYYWGSAVAVQPDGKPIISVQRKQDSQVQDIIRLNWDGSLDPTFECSLGSSGWADTIALERDGGVLIGGQFEEVNGQPRDSIARLNNTLTPPRHPADNAPADWTLSREEANAYGAAWRAGSVWTLPPNPIPVDYATRAVALWRGGPSYFWDSSISEPPLWWVDSLPPRHKEPDKDGRSWGRRDAPRHYTASQPFEVTVKLSHFPGTLAEAVQEDIPAGCSVREISDNGQVDRINRQIKWGPFTEPSHRNLRYSLVPAPTNTTPIHLVGLVCFDGSSQAIDGAAEIRPSGRLSLTHHPSHDRLGLRLEGDPGTVLVIETSTDLVDWTVLSPVTNTLGTVEIAVPLQPDSAQRYYRARVME
jgi:uncharacterized delta-60 repeat protein